MILPLLVSLVTAPASMPVADIHHGQRGQCHTVFEGDTIEPFDFEVKGIMKNFLGPHQDLILTKLLGEKPEFTGVVAGMSGSPCFINGQLIGALSYAFATFAKEPIAGITPIDSMLEIMRLPQERRPWRLDAHPTPSQSGPKVSLPKHAHRVATDADWDALRQGSTTDVHPEPTTAQLATQAQLQPIATPLQLGNVPPEVLQQFTPWLRQAGFEPVVGGSAQAANTQAVIKPLRPGDAVSGVLIGGDVDVAATGTVTYTEGDTMLAFGHPFLGAGAISVPMASASILNTMVSAMRSFKMSATGPIIGEITQDRLTGIGGQIGPAPKTILVQGSIQKPHNPQKFTLSIARDYAMTPRLLAMGVASALSGRVDASERGTVRIASTIEIENQAPVHFSNVYASNRDATLLSAAALDLGQAFQLLWNSPFAPPGDVRIHIDVHIEAEPVLESIEALQLSQTHIRAGQRLALGVRVRPQGEDPIVIPFEFEIPQAWAGHRVELIATGAEGAERIKAEIHGPVLAQSDQDIGRYLNQRLPNGKLYLLAIRSGAGFQAGGQSHAFIPASAVALFGAKHGANNQTLGIAWQDSQQRPGVIVGTARKRVRIYPSL